MATPIAAASSPQRTISFFDRVAPMRVISWVPTIRPTPTIVLTIPNWKGPACNVSRV